MDKRERHVVALMAGKKVTLTTVNQSLKILGIDEKLFKGKHYFYFGEGDASNWHESAVYVATIGEKTIEQWVEEHKRLKAASNERR